MNATTHLTVIPAIDLLDGGVVRLHQGDYAQVTRYAIDPVAHAASLTGVVPRLHLVDLEGARSGAPAQHARIAEIARAFGPGVQVGGGVRSRETVARLFDAGVSRVVLGTAAVRDPAFVRAVAEAHPGRIVLAVDARDGEVAVDGWTKGAGVSAIELARSFADVPLDALLYTDVARDGTRGGPAVEATARLARESGRPVIASGGIGTLAHLVALAETRAIAFTVVGRALLDGAFTLEAALAAARGDAPGDA